MGWPFGRVAYKSPMLNLNLLPPEEKKNVAYVIRTRAVIAVAGATGAVIAMFIILLLPTYFLSKFQETDLLRSVEIERDAERRSGISKKAALIADANGKAGALIKEIGAGGVREGLFESVLKSVPAGIALYAINYSASDQQMSIEGFSPSRAAFLQFLRALESNPAVTKVSSPPANIIKESDIKFSLTLSIR